jgi:endonuclease I
MVFTFRYILLVLVAGLARADEFSAPTSYYGASVGLAGSSLDRALRAIVGGHSVRSYDQLRQDLALTDRDWNFPPSTPSAVTNILLIYSNGWSGESRSGVWDSGVTWNREHVWPDSRGIGQPDLGPDFSDLHHLRAANPSANSSRGNSYFDVGGNIAPVIQAPLAHATTSTWEPPDIDKGWVARACLYMATRYDGSEPNTLDLELVELPPTSTLTNPSQMGRKSTLLLWNRKHPPSQWERRRNQIIYDQFQHNRNPFIDHPEFADVIYEQPAGVEILMTWRYRHFTLDELSTESVSGDAADPDGDGKSNLLEFALAGNPRGTGVSTELVLSKSSRPY